MKQQTDKLVELVIKHNGREIHRSVNWTDAYRFLHDRQPQSVSYAIRYSGYSIVEVYQSGRTRIAEG